MNTKQLTARSTGTLDRFIGGRLRAYRKERNLSQMQLGARLNISFQQIQKYEDGTNRLGAARLFEIAQVLQVPLLVFYPEADAARMAIFNRPVEHERLVEFISSDAGARLCHAFLKVRGSRLRRSIIAFLEQVSGTAENAPEAVP